MVSESLTQMLVLQDREMKLMRVEDALRTIPLEREAVLERIRTLEAELEAARQAVKELETKGKMIEGDMEAVEAQVVKYKNQQLQVKKNEEYQALTHEIENAGKKLSDLESDELEVLYALDEARKALGEQEKEVAERVARERREVEVLDAKEAEVKGQLDSAREAQATAEAALDNPTRSKYRQVARGIKFPVVVEVTGQTCAGCHMRVSNAILSESRDIAEITTCDNCGRILYSGH